MSEILDIVGPFGPVGHEADGWPAGSPLRVPHWLESDAGVPPGGIAETGYGSDTEVLVQVGGGMLTRRQADLMLSFTELLCGVALPVQDRAALQAELVKAFRRSPADATRYLNGVAARVDQIRLLRPEERARRRQNALTRAYVAERARRRYQGVRNPMMAAVGWYNPEVWHWAEHGVVLVRDALLARAEQHRHLLALVGLEPAPVELTMNALLVGADHVGAAHALDLAGSEVRLLQLRSWLSRRTPEELTRLRDELADALGSADRPDPTQVDRLVHRVCRLVDLGFGELPPTRRGRHLRPS